MPVRFSSSSSFNLSYSFTFSATRPSTSAPSYAGGGNPVDVDDIPPEIFDQGASGSRSAGRSMDMDGPAIRICPHCTFENVHRGTDCEVCGLPL